MKFEISESENTITVSVSLTERIYARDPIESVDTKKVLELLKESGYNTSEYNVEKHGVCSTLKNNQMLNDTWVLVKKEKKVRNVVKSTKQSTNRRRRATKRSPNQKNKLL